MRAHNRQRGIALLLVTVTIAVIGATAGEFAYNAQVDMEAAANSRDQLRAEYLARSSVQLGQLLVAVQGAIQKQVPPEFRDFLVITDYADFLAKAFGGDKEAREGLGSLVGLDLSNAKALGTPAGSSFDLSITSEEGKYFVNAAGGVSPDSNARQNLYGLIYNLVRPLRYDRMFNVPDQDGVVITREDLPANIIDWTDVDLQRFVPGVQNAAGGGAEERYDRGRDRYEAHNQYMDTTEEMTLIRGVSEDFWAAFGEMFTVYGGQDGRLLVSAISADQWPLIASILAASSSDRNTVYDPNTVIVAQQVAGILKTGLPALKALTKTPGFKLEPCKAEASLCGPPAPAGQQPAPASPATPRPAGAPPAAADSGDAISILSSLICSPLISQLPSLSQGLSSLLGSSAPPPPTTALRPIPLCPGKLGQFLREKAGNGNPRRYYRIDATGTIQRNAAKSTQVHIRGVWDSQSFNSTPLCTNHPSCFKGGTWVYYRID